MRVDNGPLREGCERILAPLHPVATQLCWKLPQRWVTHVGVGVQVVHRRKRAAFAVALRSGRVGLEDQQRTLSAFDVEELGWDLWHRGPQLVGAVDMEQWTRLWWERGMKPRPDMWHSQLAFQATDTLSLQEQQAQPRSERRPKPRRLEL